MTKSNIFKSLNKAISTPMAIIVIIVLAGLVAGGVLAYQYWWAPEKKIETPKIETPIDETADWKVYRNEEYGVEVKYPRDWEECELSEAELSFLKIIPPISPSDPPEGMSVETFKGYDCLFGGVRFRKLEEKYDNLHALKDYYWDLYENIEGVACDPELMIKETTFNEQPVLKREYCDVSGMYSATIISLMHNQEVFELEFSVSAIRRTGEKLIHQILSTFRFVE